MRKIDGLIPTSYAEAAKSLADHGSRTLAKNTMLVRIADSEDIGLLLHNTIVVRYTPDGWLVVNTGGWHTVTTKARMNAALRTSGFQVAQKAGRWILWSVFGGTVTLFRDGLRIHETRVLA